MEKILLFLIAGIIVGAFVKMPKIVEKLIGHLQTVGVILLLFAMGIGVGANPDLFNQLSDIGLHSLAMALGAVIGSTCLIFLLLKLLKKGGIQE